ncbi:MAG: SufE family protein [Verrucomicrobiaceae bacterium]|nr:SufE family protein [Verrucomicrobiaceae bacterium]
MTASERQQRLVDDYRLIENSFERFQIVVDTAHAKAAPFPEASRTEEHLVPGCVSRVWLAVAKREDGSFEVWIDSEAPALKSIGALFCHIYSDGTEEEIAATPPDFIEQLALDRHLTPTRLRGLGQIRKKLLERIGELGVSTHDAAGEG